MPSTAPSPVDLTGPVGLAVAARVARAHRAAGYPHVLVRPTPPPADWLYCPRCACAACSHRPGSGCRWHARCTLAPPWAHGRWVASFVPPAAPWPCSWDDLYELATQADILAGGIDRLEGGMLHLYGGAQGEEPDLAAVELGGQLVDLLGALRVLEAGTPDFAPDLAVMFRDHVHDRRSGEHSAWLAAMGDALGAGATS